MVVEVPHMSQADAVCYSSTCFNVHLVQIVVTASSDALKMLCSSFETSNTASISLSLLMNRP